MKVNLLLTILFFTCLQLFTISFVKAQDTTPKFNLNFEQNEMDNTVPDKWMRWGYYKLSKNEEVVHQGKYSGHIVSDEMGENFGSIEMFENSGLVGF